MKLKVWLTIVSIIVITGVVFTGVVVQKHSIKTNPKKARLSNAEMPVMTDKAKVTTLTEIIGASGTVEPISFVKLTARVSSRVESVKVDLGDLVRPEQVLIKFDTKIYEAALLSAQSLLGKTKTEMENAKNNFERISALYDKKLIAKSELEDAQNKFEAAKANYASALESLATAERDIKNTTLKSPVIGVVKERSVNIGETPKMDDPLLTLGVVDPAAFIAKVAEEKIASIRIGQDAEVVFDSFPNKIFIGTIVKIDPTTDPKTRTFPAYIKITNNRLQLKPGLTGFARIKNRRTLLAIPSVSVINPVKDEATAFVVDSNGVAHIRPVKIGMAMEGFTEVVGGLTEGENVVTVGQANLRDKDKVMIGKEYVPGEAGNDE